MKLKFCGFKTKEDIEQALTCNIDYLGLIFAKSKRQIDKYMGLEIIKDIDFGKVKLVGVFMDQSLEDVIETTKLLNLDVIQVHGSESFEYLSILKKRTNKEIWRAIPSNDDSLKSFNMIPADVVLIDSTKGGGSGELADWNLIRKYEKDFNKPYLLAGGLGLNCIDKEFGKLNPQGLDICSGIEINGSKNLELMKKISRMVKNDG